MDFVVQASTRSWSGGRDICMNTISDIPAVIITVKKIKQKFPDSKIIVACPEFDKNGGLEGLVKEIDSNISVYYGEDSNPLQRILNACNEKNISGYICRIDGLNIFFLDVEVDKMYMKALRDKLDCIKFPDSFPPQLSFDIYKVSALKKVAEEVSSNSPYVVHPKFWMFQNSGTYRCDFYNSFVTPTNDFLLNARAVYRDVYLAPRDNITSNSISVGDMLSFHYQLALPYIKIHDTVLDAASGNGAGTKLLAERALKVFGIDISEEIISRAKEENSQSNIVFSVGDVTSLNFSKNYFDVITSFETIEHVSVSEYIEEVYRVLKPNGLLILSTPQNMLGHIPLNPQHDIEFSKTEIQNILSEKFMMISFLSIKQGRIIDQNGDGTNSFIVARKI